MKHFLALLGVVAALTMAVPMVAQADSYRHVERTGPRGGHHERNVYRHNGHVDYRHMQRRSFGHWRPGLERRHYRSFGRPVFYDYYYRVRAHDNHGRLVLLTVNAFTGAIIAIGR